MKQQWWMAALAALSLSAAAGDDFDDQQPWLSSLRLSWDFGQAGPERLRLQFAASQPVVVAQQTRLFPLVAVELDSAAGPSSMLLGLPLGSRAAAGSGEAGVSHWVWAGAALVGTLGVVALSAGSGGPEANTQIDGARSGCQSDITAVPPNLSSNCPSPVPQAGAGQR